MTERPWLNFYFAANEIEQRLGVSGGMAMRMLRQACASGDVRSRRQPCNPATGVDEGPHEPVKPSDWTRGEVDLEFDAHGCGYFVDVDEADFRYWLNSATKNNAQKVTNRGSPKRRLAEHAIKKLWPGGIPSNLLNKQIEKEVADWLKQQDLAQVSPDTILRAAGKK
jgi:hypothetical protein